VKPLCTGDVVEIIHFSVEDQRLIAAALLRPPALSPALQRAFDLRRKLFGNDDDCRREPSPDDER